MIFRLNLCFSQGPESFYVTNDHYFRFGRSVLRMLELLVIARGSIVYYDGSRAMYAASGIWFPNGINMDQSGRFAIFNITVNTGLCSTINPPE